MKKILLILSLLFVFVSANAQVPTDLADLQAKINAWVVTNGNKQITATQIHDLLIGIKNLMVQYSVNGAFRIADTLFLTGPNLTTIKVTMSAGSGGDETDPTVPLVVKAITSTNISTWNSKQAALTPGSTIDIISNVITAKNTSPFWNANQIQGHAVSSGNPTNGQTYIWNASTAQFELSAVSINNLYTANGTLTGTRTVSGAGIYNIYFQNLGLFDAEAGQVYLAGSNNSSLALDGNKAQIEVGGSGTISDQFNRGDSVMHTVNRFGVDTTIHIIKPDRIRTIPYGQGRRQTGTPNFLLGFDINSKWIEVPLASVGRNIYNSNGTLPGDRNLELAQHVLTIKDSLNYNSIRFYTGHVLGGTTSGNGAIDFVDQIGQQIVTVGGDSTHGGIQWHGASNQGYLVFSPSGARWNDQSGTYIIFNVPSTTDTTKKALVYDPVSQSLSYMDLWSRAAGGGNPFADNSALVKNNSDNTKRLIIGAANVTTSTTRTLQSPDANGTILLNDNTATLTNKTIAAGSNTITGLTNSNLSGSAAISNTNLANSAITINGSSTSLGGSATVTDASLSTSNITTNDVNITKHGFVPIAPNDVTKYLDGTGNWSVPPNAGDVVTTITSGTSSTVPNGTNIIRFNSTTVLTYTLTLGTTWHSSNDLLIAFTSNATIANGSPMVTLTIVNGSGHTLSYATSPNATYVAGEIVRFHLISTIEQRIN